jgi:cell division protein FtsQ
VTTTLRPRPTRPPAARPSHARRPEPRQVGSRQVGSRQIDPRIRDRRIAVRRAEGRQRLHRLLIALGALALAGAAVGAVFSPVLDVNRVVVRGVSGVQEPAVHAASQVERGEPILLADLGAAERQVEALPWVATAHLERELPGTVTITVTPRQAVAWVRAEGGAGVLIDATGVVIGEAGPSSPGQPQPVLPEMHVLDSVPAPGHRITDPVDRTLARVAAAVPPEYRSRFRSVRSVSGRIMLVVTDGAAIQLGAPRQIEAKVRVALAVLDAAGPVSFVDVRVPSAPVAG